MLNNSFNNRFLYEMMWKNIVEPERPQMRVGRMHISRWVPKAKNKQSKYVILIAFLLQQLLRKRFST